MDRIHSLLLGLALVSVLSSAGCQHFGLGYAHIGELLSSPQKFADREVRIQGKVTSVFKLPLMATRLYVVKDETGEIVVRSEREPPLSGATTHVRGKLDTVAVVGDQNVGLHLREIERW